MILYHITKNKNIPKILNKGILTGKKSKIKGLNITSKIFDKVFLTNNVDKIIRQQIGKQEYLKHYWIVIEIDCTDLEIKPHEYHYHGTYTLSDFEFTTKYIPKEKIIKYYKSKLTSYQF